MFRLRVLCPDIVEPLLGASKPVTDPDASFNVWFEGLWVRRYEHKVNHTFTYMVRNYNDQVLSPATLYTSSGNNLSWSDAHALIVDCCVQPYERKDRARDICNRAWHKELWTCTLVEVTGMFGYGYVVTQDGYNMLHSTPDGVLRVNYE